MLISPPALLNDSAAIRNQVLEQWNTEYSRFGAVAGEIVSRKAG
jgi:hypothetical protein